MAEFFARNLDYVNFVFGLSFVLLAALCRGLASSFQNRLALKWLSLFGLFHGLTTWLDMAALSQGDNLAFRTGRLIFILASFVALLEFGRRSLVNRQGTPVFGTWFIPGLSVLVAWANPESGLAGLDAASRYSLAIPGCLLAAVVFFMTADREVDSWKRRGLTLTAVCFLSFGFCELITPEAPFPLASWLNCESFFRATGVHIQVVRALFMVGVMSGLWIFRVRGGGDAITSPVKGFPWMTPLVFLTLLILGWMAAEWRGENRDQEQRARLLEQASALSRAVHPDDVRSLSFTAKDKTAPRFERLRQQLVAAARILSCRGIFTIALRNGNLIYGPQTYTLNDPLAASPGTLFQTAGPETVNLLYKREPFIGAVSKWRGETLITAYAPVFDLRTGQVLMNIGLDINPTRWKERIAQARLPPIIGVMTLLLVLLIGIDAIRRRERLPPAGQGSLRHLEILLVFLCGMVITGFFTLLTHETEVRRRHTVFDRLADSRASQIRDEMISIRSDLFSLARFFESSEEVSQAEFATFAGSMVQADAVEAFGWIPIVSDDNRDMFQKKALRDGTRTNTIWQLSLDGSRTEAGRRPVYYPLMFVEPHADNSEALGFDLGSDSEALQSIRQSLRSGLWTATPALTLVHQPVLKAAMILFHPVSIPSRPGTHSPTSSITGFTMSMVRYQDLLIRASSRAGLGERFLNINLLDLTEQGKERLLAAHPEKQSPPIGRYTGRALPLLSLQPLFAFGRTFVVVAHPSDAFMSAYPINGSLIAAAGGVLLSLLLTVFVAFLRNRQWRLEHEVQQRTAALRESELQYRLLAEHASDVIGRIAPDGSYLFLSPGIVNLLGYEPADLVGRNMKDKIHPEDIDSVTAAFSQALARPEGASFIMRHQHKDGTWRWMETRGKRVLEPGLEQPKEVIVVSRDITERKLAEENRLEMERRLLHAQKLESLGVLTGGIAHDFNNLLTAVLGNLELSIVGLPPVSTTRRGIDNAIHAAKRAADLTRQMLAYSGKGMFIIEDINLNELVEENAHMLKAAISKTVTLNLSLSPELPPIRADSGQIQQIIMNLITNASEAIGEKAGVVRLSTGVGHFTEDDLASSRLPDKPAPGPFVWIEVADTGCGMNDETINRVFEPFFTTKFAGRGLGMSAVLGIVRGHKGAILIDSEPNRGSTVRVLFPAWITEARESIRNRAVPEPIPEPPPPPAPEPVQVSLPLGEEPVRGTILVVDDEQIVRDLCVAFVTCEGWRPLSAVDGEDGVEVFRKHASEITAVILDLTMPKMDGATAFREMRKIRPDIRVILSSGHAEQEAFRRFDAEGVAGFLQKPYDLKMLATMLDRITRGSQP